VLFTEVLARAAGHPYSCTVMKQGESCCSRSGVHSSAVLLGERSAVWLQSIGWPLVRCAARRAIGCLAAVVHWLRPHGWSCASCESPEGHTPVTFNRP